MGLYEGFKDGFYGASENEATTDPISPTTHLPYLHPYIFVYHQNSFVNSGLFAAFFSLGALHQSPEAAFSSC